MFQLENVSYRWHSDKPLLEKLDCTIPSNSLTTIIGPNGCGKSTLARILLGLVQPDRGAVVLYGRKLPAYSKRELSRMAAYVSQDPNQPVPLTVREIVALGWSTSRGHTGQADSIADRVAGSMSLAGVNHLAERIFVTLSMGEKQKVMLARALCQTRSVLVLDEPTASLDFKNQIEIMELLKRLVREEGVSVVMVSHDLNLINRYASHVLAIDQVTCMLDTRDRIMDCELLTRLYGVEIRRIESNGESVFVY
jgi:ABC-type cobalamin/Fe3+-siderophores transport system ATPase subunit